MKIYIAGKITGLDWTVAKAKFAMAALALVKAGHIVLCPTEMFPENPVWDWAEYMLADLRIIWHHADAVLMLDNWKDSNGATLERQAALFANKTVYYALDEIEPFGLSPNATTKAETTESNVKE